MIRASEQKKVSLTELGPIIEEALYSGRNAEIVVTGNSMFPLFSTERDSVQITRPKKYKNHDIAFFKRDNGRYVLHRILKITKDGYYCVGDNQTEFEGPLREDQMLGVVKEYVRKGKRKSVRSVKYRLYVFIWCLIRPIRMPTLRFLLKIKKLFKKKKK